jgi:hypothetical protein
VPTQAQGLSQEWKTVKSKRGSHAAGKASAGAFNQRPQPAPPAFKARPLPPEYKKLFQGKCFRCLARDHQVVHCREPPRCVSCFRSGHFAHHCRALIFASPPLSPASDPAWCSPRTPFIVVLCYTPEENWSRDREKLGKEEEQLG